MEMIVFKAGSNLNVFVLFDESVKVVSDEHEVFSSAEVVVSNDFDNFSVFWKKFILEYFEF